VAPGYANLPAIFKCYESCEQLGLDMFDAAMTIALAMELYQRGIITKQDADGMALEWGDEDVVIELLTKMARRQGIGNLLAEGSKLAAEKLGKDAQKYVLTIKGMAPCHIGLRAGLYVLYNLGHLTSPRGGDNVRTTHMAVRGIDFVPRIALETMRDKGMSQDEIEERYIKQLSMPKDLKREIYGEPPRMGPFSHRQMALLMKWCEEMLLWMFNIREGVTVKDLDWPDRFYDEPIPDGPAKGGTVSREMMRQTLDTYYEVRGWDKETGMPTREKLEELGLADLANDLG